MRRGKTRNFGALSKAKSNAQKCSLATMFNVDDTTSNTRVSYTIEEWPLSIEEAAGIVQRKPVVKKGRLKGLLANNIDRIRKMGQETRMEEREQKRRASKLRGIEAEVRASNVHGRDTVLSVGKIDRALADSPDVIEE